MYCTHGGVTVSPPRLQRRGGFLRERKSKGKTRTPSVYLTGFVRTLLNGRMKGRFFHVDETGSEGGTAVSQKPLALTFDLQGSILIRGIRFSVQTGSRGSDPLRTVVSLQLWQFSPGMAISTGVCTLQVQVVHFGQTQDI